ncbi:hypothetical protein Tco_0888325 [Tanacetum coccineum]
MSSTLLTSMQEVILFYNVLDVPTRQILDSKGDIPSMNATNAKKSMEIKKVNERVHALGLRERMELDLESRLMGEAFILNRSLDHIYGDYIELNDLNEPLELRRNQVEDLGSTIEDGEVIDEPMIEEIKTRNDNQNNGINEYPSFCDNDRKIHIDGAYNL